MIRETQPTFFFFFFWQGENTELILDFRFTRGFHDSSVGKNPPAMQETPVQFLGQEDPLEDG